MFNLEEFHWHATRNLKLFLLMNVCVCFWLLDDAWVWKLNEIFGGWNYLKVNLLICISVHKLYSILIFVCRYYSHVKHFYFFKLKCCVLYSLNCQEFAPFSIWVVPLYFLHRLLLMMALQTSSLSLFVPPILLSLLNKIILPPWGWSIETKEYYCNSPMRGLWSRVLSHSNV